jgi:hypothetical protein
VAHACNPSYSGGRDQEDLGSMATPGQIVHFETLSQNKPITRKGWSSNSSNMSQGLASIRP